jgi:predicted nucleotidyltransferase
MAFLSARATAEHDLSNLVDTLRSTLGNHLASVILFGSMASGEFREGPSDINLLVVLGPCSPAQLATLAKPLKRWTKRGHPAPLFATSVELPAIARSHPIEFLDILDHHRICYGIEVLSGLLVDRRWLRAQCEHDLSLLILRLRQGVAAAGPDRARLQQLLIQSIPSALSLIRAALRLEGEMTKLGKTEAARRLAAMADFDAGVLEKIAALHQRGAAEEPMELLRRYIAQMEKVFDYVRRKL